MPSCFSALFPRARSARRGEEEPVSPPPSREEKLPSSQARSAHSSCGQCTAWGSDLLPSYSPQDLESSSSSPTAAKPLPMSSFSHSLAQDIHNELQALSPTLRDLSLKMWDLHEPAFTEHKTHDLFVDFFRGLDKEGWEITPHANGLDTAWRAEFVHHSKKEGKGAVKSKNGKIPTVGFQSELDSLPGIGHACGHNLIAIGGVGAALSVASALVKHDVTGRVVLLGTPAEEGGGGKVIMLEDGAYDGMDACLMIHPCPEEMIGPLLAVVPITVSFTGATAHAGGFPEQGINAQDAAILSYNNISLLRQQLASTVRVHGIIIADPDWAPNVIPGKSKMVWNVRSTTRTELDLVKAKVLKCFQAAALATGCKVEIEEGRAYDDVRNLQRLTDDYVAFMKEEFEIEYARKPIAVSTDFGNISYHLPSVHPMYKIPIQDPKTQGNHTVGFTAASRTPAAHEATLKATEGIAVLGARVLVEEEYREALWREWKEWKKGTKKGE